MITFWMTTSRLNNLVVADSSISIPGIDEQCSMDEVLTWASSWIRAWLHTRNHANIEADLHTE